VNPSRVEPRLLLNKDESVFSISRSKTRNKVVSQCTELASDSKRERL